MPESDRPKSASKGTDRRNWIWGAAVGLLFVLFAVLSAIQMARVNRLSRTADDYMTVQTELLRACEASLLRLKDRNAEKEVLLAAEDIPAGTELRLESVTAAAVPARILTDATIPADSLPTLEGAKTLIPITRGEILSRNALILSSDEKALGQPASGTKSDFP